MKTIMRIALALFLSLSIGVNAGPVWRAIAGGTSSSQINGVKEYSCDGTFTVPAGVTSIFAYAIGGGGGGNLYSSTVSGGGGGASCIVCGATTLKANGGNGGVYNINYPQQGQSSSGRIAVTPGDTCSIYVGGGGGTVAQIYSGSWIYYPGAGGYGGGAAGVCGGPPAAAGGGTVCGTSGGNATVYYYNSTCQSGFAGYGGTLNTSGGYYSSGGGSGGDGATYWSNGSTTYSSYASVCGTGSVYGLSPAASNPPGYASRTVYVPSRGGYVTIMW